MLCTVLCCAVLWLYANTQIDHYEFNGDCAACPAGAACGHNNITGNIMFITTALLFLLLVGVVGGVVGLDVIGVILLVALCFIVVFIVFYIVFFSLLSLFHCCVVVVIAVASYC